MLVIKKENSLIFQLYSFSCPLTQGKSSCSKWLLKSVTSHTQRTLCSLLTTLIRRAEDNWNNYTLSNTPSLHICCCSILGPLPYLQPNLGQYTEQLCWERSMKITDQLPDNFTAKQKLQHVTEGIAQMLWEHWQAPMLLGGLPALYLPHSNVSLYLVWNVLLYLVQVNCIM